VATYHVNVKNNACTCNSLQLKTLFLKIYDKVTYQLMFCRCDLQKRTITKKPVKLLNKSEREPISTKSVVQQTMATKGAVQEAICLSGHSVDFTTHTSTICIWYQVLFGWWHITKQQMQTHINYFLLSLSNFRHLLLLFCFMLFLIFFYSFSFCHRRWPPSLPSG
jgi:hypothetical protein